MSKAPPLFYVQPTAFGRVLNAPAQAWGRPPEPDTGEALQRRGWILLAWARFWWGGSEHWACWMQETGARWVYEGFARPGPEGLNPSYRIKTIAFAREVIMKRIGKALEYREYALHLTEPGPDRRAAYLKRRTSAEDLTDAELFADGPREAEGPRLLPFAYSSQVDF